MKLLSWIKELPQWIQDEILQSSHVRDIFEFIEKNSYSLENQINKILEDLNKSPEEKFEHEHKNNVDQKYLNLLLDNVTIFVSNDDAIDRPDINMRLDDDLSYLNISILPRQAFLASTALFLFTSHSLAFIGDHTEMEFLNILDK